MDMPHGLHGRGHTLLFLDKVVKISRCPPVANHHQKSTCGALRIRLVFELARNPLSRILRSIGMLYDASRIVMWLISTILWNVSPLIFTC